VLNIFVPKPDSDGPLQYENTFENGYTKVEFFFRSTLSSGDRSTVTIQFTKGVGPAQDGELYAIGYQWTWAPVLTRVVMKLPKNSELLDTSENSTSVYTENGALMVKWVKVMENSFGTDVGFRLLSAPPADNQENMETVPPQPESSDVSLYVTAIALAFLFAGAIIVIARPKKPRQPKAIEPKAPLPKLDIDKILQLLSDNERAVVNLLLKQDNVAQKILCEKTGTPKATMSRTVKNLESKKLVKSVGVGAWKRVRLTRWVKQWKEQPRGSSTPGSNQKK